MKSGYRVYVDDNFHFMDEDERWVAGEFETYEEAVARCKSMVSEFFEKAESGDSAEKLYEAYTMFGDDPWISSFGDAAPPPALFSSWDYAKQYAEEIVQNRGKR